MRFALLNKRARFQSIVDTPDGGGGTVRDWADYVTVWACLVPDRAREKIRQGRIADDQSGVLKVRSSTATRLINSAYRVIVGGVTYNIRSHSNPDQRNDMLEFLIEVDGTVPVQP